MYKNLCYNTLTSRQESRCVSHMSQLITRPAALVKQGNLLLYTTSLPVADLMTQNFYSIERLDPSDASGGGYQRVLNTARAKKLADYLIEGQQTHDAFLPTSIFLATDKDISLNPTDNTITFDVAQVGPFSVVDGQHRLEGLRLAWEKKPEIADFQVPVNIAVNMSPIAQMCHFLIVNTTQKSVDKSVEQRIFAHLTKNYELEDVPNLPKWIRRVVESKEDQQALAIADYLNAEPSSPWYNKIKMANRDKSATSINQQSFVKITKQYVLTANNPLSAKTPDQQKGILLNYWKAISNLLGDDKPSVLFKYNGVDLFSRFSTPLFSRLQNTGSFSVATIQSTLQAVFDNMDGDYAGVGHPEWWRSSGGPASGLNHAAIAKANNELLAALHQLETIPTVML